MSRSRHAGPIRPTRRGGFTLVEVLIASVILFASLAVISEAYRTSLVASERARITAELLTPLPLIVEHVRDRLLDTPQEKVDGRGEVLGVRFEFLAVSARFAAPPRRVDADSGQIMVYQPRFRVYDVRLTLAAGSVRRVFSYQELAWLPAAV